MEAASIIGPPHDLRHAVAVTISQNCAYSDVDLYVKVALYQRVSQSEYQKSMANVR